MWRELTSTEKEHQANRIGTRVVRKQILLIFYFSRSIRGYRYLAECWVLSNYPINYLKTYVCHRPIVSNHSTWSVNQLVRKIVQVNYYMLEEAHYNIQRYGISTTDKTKFLIFPSDEKLLENVDLFNPTPLYGQVISII